MQEYDNHNDFPKPRCGNHFKEPEMKITKCSDFDCPPCCHVVCVCCQNCPCHKEERECFCGCEFHKPCWHDECFECHEHRKCHKCHEHRKCNECHEHKECHKCHEYEEYDD